MLFSSVGVKRVGSTKIKNRRNDPNQTKTQHPGMSTLRQRCLRFRWIIFLAVPVARFRSSIARVGANEHCNLQPCKIDCRGGGSHTAPPAYASCCSHQPCRPRNSGQTPLFVARVWFLADRRHHSLSPSYALIYSNSEDGDFKERVRGEAPRGPVQAIPESSGDWRGRIPGIPPLQTSAGRRPPGTSSRRKIGDGAAYTPTILVLSSSAASAPCLSRSATLACWILCSLGCGQLGGSEYTHNSSSCDSLLSPDSSSRHRSFFSVHVRIANCPCLRR